MATYTPNLNLKKPSTNEYYDVVADLNDAKDKIDNEAGIVREQLDKFNKSKPIYLTDYAGADKTGLTSSSAALQQAILDATAQRRKLYIPSGTYLIDTPVTADLGAVDLTVEGEGYGEVRDKTRLLWRGGSGTIFTFTNGRNVRFHNIDITGYDNGTDVIVFPAGSVGFNSAASLIFDHCALSGFETIAQWNGGYYHKIMNCYIRYTKNGFKDFNANNLIFENCKMDSFETMLTVNGGSGPVVINQCSIEKFTGIVFSAVAGAYPLLKVSDSYIENYPNITPPAGITGDYESAYLANGFGSFIFEDNIIFAKGIRRVINSNALVKLIISKGNNILYRSTDSNLAYYMYVLSGVETIHASDVAYDVLSSYGGAQTPVYISSPQLVTNKNSLIYDPFKKSTYNTNRGSTRPTNVSTGFIWFDTTLNKPIWFDGTGWVDASGTVV